MSKKRKGVASPPRGSAPQATIETLEITEDGTHPFCNIQFDVQPDYDGRLMMKVSRPDGQLVYASVACDSGDWNTPALDGGSSLTNGTNLVEIYGVNNAGDLVQRFGSQIIVL